MNFFWFDIFIPILSKKSFADKPPLLNPLVKSRLSLSGVQYSIYFWTQGEE